MDKIVRDFKGVWIDEEIWLDHNLTWMEKLMITEINSLDNDKGCWASNNYLAGFFNLSASRISQIINNLIKKCYISVTYNYRKNSKEIESRVLRILKGGIKNTKGGYLENAEGINTKINNTKREGIKNQHEEFVYLTTDQYNKLVDKWGKTNTDSAIYKLNNYLGSSGKKYVSHYHTLLKWGFDGIKPLEEWEKDKICADCGKKYIGYCRCMKGKKE